MTIEETPNLGGFRQVILIKYKFGYHFIQFGAVESALGSRSNTTTTIKTVTNRRGFLKFKSTT